MFLLPLIIEAFAITNVLPWLAPLLVPGFVGGIAGYGSFRFAHGSLMQRITTIERDVTQSQAERAEFVTRNEFELLREDLRDIKRDIREVRRTLTK